MYFVSSKILFWIGQYDPFHTIILLCFYRISLSLGLVPTNLKCVMDAFFKKEFTSSMKTREKLWVKFIKDTPATHIKIKGQGHTKVKNVQNMLSHGDTHICQNLVCLCQRAKTFCQTQTHGENIILILRSKVKVIAHECTWHIVPWWYTHVPNKIWLCQRTKKLRPEHKAM